MGRTQKQKLSRGLLLAAILVGWALALSRLGERSLWADEGATAYQALQSHPPAAMLKLHEGYSFAHLSLTTVIVRLSRHEMALRLPSAVAAVLALPVVYALGCRLFGRVAGLVSAILLAISPFALGYAQEARVYAILELLSVLSLLLLVVALERRRWMWWVGFSLSIALLLYAHYFGWFVIAAEALWASSVLLWKTARERRVDRRLLWLAASLAGAVGLYAPLIPEILGFLNRYGPGASPAQLAGLYPFKPSLRLVRDILSVFGARASGWQLYLYGGGIVAGVASLAIRKKWQTLLLVICWFAVPLAALSVIRSQHFFSYRYLIFLLPVFLLMVAEGLSGMTFLLARVQPLARFGQAHVLLAVGLVCLLFVPANFPALREHHRGEKENWRGIGWFLQAHWDEGEALFVSPRFWAYPLLFYQPSLQPYLVGGGQVDELEQAARQHTGLWFIRYGGSLGDPKGELGAWIADHGFELLIDGKACGVGIHVYYGGLSSEAQARQTELLREAAAFCPVDPRFQPGQD